MTLVADTTSTTLMEVVGETSPVPAGNPVSLVQRGGFDSFNELELECIPVSLVEQSNSFGNNAVSNSSSNSTEREASRKKKKVFNKSI